MMRAKKMIIERSVPPPSFGVRTMQKRSRNNSFLYVALTIVALVVAAGVIGGVKDDALLMEQRQYCSMVALHNETPDIGWPDFRNTFHDECTADGGVKGDK